MKIPKIKKLILSGGGIKGIAICGAIEKLDEQIKLLSTVKTIIGTSVSSYIAFFLAIGLPIRKIRLIFESINFSEFQEFDIKLLISKFGLDEGNKFQSFIKATMITQNIDPNITFKQLQEISKYEIIIVGANITNSKPAYFSAKDTPDMQVCTAMRISGGYPLAFTPIELDGELYADGGLVSPIASELITKKDKKHTLGIVLHRGYKKCEVNELQEYGLRVISCLVDSLLDSKLMLLKHYIMISYPINSMDLDIGKEDKINMVECGKLKAEEWIKHFSEK